MISSPSGQASPDASQRPTLSSAAPVDLRSMSVIRRSNSPTSTLPTLVVPSRSISALIWPAACLSTIGTAATAAPASSDDGERRNDCLLHGSASGCLEGWAASKAGCFMQVA